MLILHDTWHEATWQTTTSVLIIAVRLEVTTACSYPSSTPSHWCRSCRRPCATGAWAATSSTWSPAAATPSSRVGSHSVQCMHASQQPLSSKRCYTMQLPMLQCRLISKQASCLGGAAYIDCTPTRADDHEFGMTRYGKVGPAQLAIASLGPSQAWVHKGVPSHCWYHRRCHSLT